MIKNQESNCQKKIEFKMEKWKILKTVDGSNGTQQDIYWWRNLDEKLMSRDGVEVLYKYRNPSIGEEISENLKFKRNRNKIC